MELQLVSFEQAKALKELGFPKDGILQYHQCPYCFYNGYCINIQDDFGEYSKVANNEILYAPTLELVAKWLRDEKDILIEPTPSYNIHDEFCGFHYELYVNYKSSNNSWETMATTVLKYEDALSAGIDKAIEIIKGE